MNPTYRGQNAAIRAPAPRARNFTNQRYRWGDGIDEAIKCVPKLNTFLASSNGSSASKRCATGIGPKICIDFK